ncbi:histidine phosphatase family protein [Entomobacter blattae]|nr:histidine phosphatase family protein [Entomobacter blattae]
METGPFQSYCSPYRNAEQTAHWLEIPSSCTNALADCSYGTWGGMPLKTIADQHPTDYQKWLQQSDFIPSQGESLFHVQQRAIQWIHTLTTHDFPSQKTIMAITHPAIIKGLLCEVLQCPLSPNFPVDIAPLTVSSLTHRRKWRIHQVSTPLL